MPGHASIEPWSRRGTPRRVRPPSPLTQRALPRLADRIGIPRYDRAALRRGVVHISVGSFHRSHQAAYFDALACAGHDGWGLTGVGLHRRQMKEVLSAQDGLYLLVERSPGRSSARAIGAITRYLFAPEEADDVLDALADRSTRLVTLTITVGGYGVDPLTGLPAAAPTGAVALLAAALRRRRAAGLAPFTVLACDNVPGNGASARAAVVDAAERLDPALARWIDAEGAFPSCMVDRITPGTSIADRERVWREFGVADRWPVVTEPFSQWVIEDAFCAGRPPLDAVGAQFVDDVRPYSLMKTRLLNGTHSALGYLGRLAGHARLDEVMDDAVLAAYAESLMDREIAPLLPQGPAETAAYGATLRERFANPAVADPLARLCRNGSAKVPAHLLTSIRESRALGRRHPRLTLAVAAWCLHLRGDGVDDPEAVRLRRLARDLRALLADETTFGPLAGDVTFADDVQQAAQALEAHGVHGLLSGQEIAR